MRSPLSRNNNQQNDNINQELKKGSWDEEEDRKLVDYIREHGPGNWQSLPKRAGLDRCGKSCRLRWINYLRPGIKHGNFTPEEDKKIIEAHSLVGNKWSLIAKHLPERTDNEIKNYWNTNLSKRLFRSGIDPTTHQPITDLNRMLHNLNHISYKNHILPINPLDSLNNSIRVLHEYTNKVLQLIDNARTLNPTSYKGSENNFLGLSYGLLGRDFSGISLADPNSQASSSIINDAETIGSIDETIFYNGYQENDGMICMGSTSTMSNEHDWQLPELINLPMPDQASSDAISYDQEFLSGLTTDFVDAAINYDDLRGNIDAIGSFGLKDDVFYGSS